MMNQSIEMKVLLLLLPLSMSTLIFSAAAEEDEANYLPYDYSATVECVKNTPIIPQYNGGILQLVNPQLLQTNNITILSNTPIFLEKDLLYTFSAWVQLISTTNTSSSPNQHQGALVSAVFETPGSSSSNTTTAGWVLAQPGCWSMLKGGLTVPSSTPSFLHFHTNDTSPNNLLITSLSLQPFTQTQWKSHQTHSIQTTRKTKLKFKLPHHTNITIKLKKLTFPFGVAINKNILTNPSYKNWFTSRPFTVTAFENEMKWYTTEPTPHHLDYSSPDSLLTFIHQLHIQLRGHNILWDDPRYQPQWVNSLTPNQLQLAAHHRIQSLISKYKGKVISWDVVNENLHFSFFEDRLGKTASNQFYNFAKTIDTTQLFLNDYNTIEESNDPHSNPPKYIAKLKDLTHYLNILPPNRIGIGLESHFPTKLNLPYMRASLDLLSATGSPIWLTEVDVLPCPNQPHILEQILREAHSHPGVYGILLWSAWSPNGCYRMCLTDNMFTNLPTGDVVDKLIREWGGTIKSNSPEPKEDENQQVLLLSGDHNGFTDDVSLFHGEYEVVVYGVHGNESSSNATIKKKLFRVDADGCTDMETLLLLNKKEEQSLNASVVVVPLVV